MIAYRNLTSVFVHEGRGLHSGQNCRLTIEPADELLFRLDGRIFPIGHLGLEGTGRGSDLLFPGGSRLRTCEHLLSALAGLGVWGALIAVDGPEMPAFDGCAVQVSEWIMRNSRRSQEGPEPFALPSPLHVGDCSRFVVALPSPLFHVSYVIDYQAEAIGTQILDYSATEGEYLETIAPARTFAMAEDIEALRAQGLALGGSFDNAILVDDAEVRTTGGLRFPDEFVRHKTLDLIGDLAMLGRPLIAHVVAVRAGHAQHLQLVERLRAFSCKA